MLYHQFPYEIAIWVETPSSDTPKWRAEEPADVQIKWLVYVSINHSQLVVVNGIVWVSTLLSLGFLEMDASCSFNVEDGSALAILTHTHPTTQPPNHPIPFRCTRKISRDVPTSSAWFEVPRAFRGRDHFESVSAPVWKDQWSESGSRHPTTTYHLVMTFTVRHGKSPFIIGKSCKPSISMGHTMAMLVITRG